MTATKTLRLKKPLDFEQQARLSQILGVSILKDQPKKKNADNRNKKPDRINVKEEKGSADLSAVTRFHIKRKALTDSIDWLCSTYPECFSKEDPKPLKIGIFNDILLRGQWPYSKTFLRQTLKFYTGSSLYQKAIVQLTLRYGLEGETSQNIRAFEKENSIKKKK